MLDQATAAPSADEAYQKLDAAKGVKRAAWERFKAARAVLVKAQAEMADAATQHNAAVILEGAALYELALTRRSETA